MNEMASKISWIWITHRPFSIVVDVVVLCYYRHYWITSNTTFLWRNSRTFFLKTARRMKSQLLKDAVILLPPPSLPVGLLLRHYCQTLDVFVSSSPNLVACAEPGPNMVVGTIFLGWRRCGHCCFLCRRKRATRGDCRANRLFWRDVIVIRLLTFEMWKKIVFVIVLLQ